MGENYSNTISFHASVGTTYWPWGLPVARGDYLLAVGTTCWHVVWTPCRLWGRPVGRGDDLLLYGGDDLLALGTTCCPWGLPIGRGNDLLVCGVDALLAVGTTCYCLVVTTC